MFNLTVIRDDCGPEGAAYTFTTPQGGVVLVDVGDQQHADGYCWGVTITYNGQAFLFSYNGQGDLSLHFDKEGRLSAQTEGNGKITPLQSPETR
jgi:hypothetical protein